MYPNKLTISSMSFYDFLGLTFFHEIPYSICHKYVLSQHNCIIGPYKNKNSPNVNIQRYTKFQTNIQTQISPINFINKKWAKISKFNPKLANLTQYKYFTCHKS